MKKCAIILALAVLGAATPIHAQDHAVLKRIPTRTGAPRAKAARQAAPSQSKVKKLFSKLGKKKMVRAQKAIRSK